MGAPPFFRGFNRFDLFFVAVIGQQELYGQSPGVEACFQAIEPGISEHFPGNDVVPNASAQVGDNYVIIDCGGTNSMPIWALNFLGSAQQAMDPFPGKVDLYFGAAAANILNRILAFIAPDLATKKVVVVGHSLGGAIAQLITSALQPLCLEGISCISLAAPRVGDQAFADSIAGVTIRVENTLDPIPALPPTTWVGIGSKFPIPGVGEAATYVHAGNAMTLDELGNLSSGSNPPSLSYCASVLYTGAFTPHYTTEYARRLLAQMDPAGFTPENTGFDDPQVLLFQYDGTEPNPEPSPLPQTGGGMKKVTVFYSLYNRGITESYWTPADNFSDVQNGIQNYLAARLGIACQEFSFVYARASDVNTPRQVFWFTPDSLGISGTGLAGAGSAVAHLAALLRGQTLLGGSMRQFLHGFPGKAVKNNDFDPNSSWKLSSVRGWADFLVKSNGVYQYKTLNESGSSSKFDIASITPLSPRGATIAVGTALPGGLLNPGDTVYLGGAGARQVGMTGRKVVTSIATNLLSFTIGGGAPIGVMQAGAYFRANVYQYSGLLYGALERLSDHRVGKVFGLRPGRQSNAIPLRQ